LAIIRVRQRWQWIEASLHKIGDPAWVGNGAVLKGFWLRGVAIPQPPGVGDIVEAGPRLHRDERNPDSLTHLLPHTAERLPGRSSVFFGDRIRLAHQPAGNPTAEGKNNHWQLHASS